ncbi:MAG: type I 3-dehydroquinate dehydratase [Desulfobulbaceae bacterium]|jgi:3-dehydroquinate dehydratase-1/3-dehydroquinate dehydratase/shikimate dehydrogenase|nr:type I 3-dehydroquinate dehydratase [Desulfobulbaceae bacterium]
MTTQTGLICVSVAAKDGQGILDTVSPVVLLADVVEIRLDHMINPKVDDWIAGIPKPVLVTNRPVWEGGQFAGSEQERIDLLCKAVRSGAQYVDIELQTAQDLRMQVLDVARQHRTKVIVSSHDFQGTPPIAQLRETLQQMIASGGDIGKIVTTATNPGEALHILSLQQEAVAASFPLSAFAMGTAGKITRLATLYLGGYMTYAAITAQQATAPGQLSIHELHALITLLETTA